MLVILLPYKNMKNEIEELFRAIEALDVSKVEELLINGADANAIHPIYYTYPDWDHQPYAPLRLIVFYLSDSLLELEDYDKLYEIAILLLSYGADPKKAIELAESRYGKFNPNYESPANKVLLAIHNALK